MAKHEHQHPKPTVDPAPPEPTFTAPPHDPVPDGTEQTFTPDSVTLGQLQEQVFGLLIPTPTVAYILGGVDNPGGRWENALIRVVNPNNGWSEDFGMAGTLKWPNITLNDCISRGGFRTA